MSTKSYLQFQMMAAMMSMGSSHSFGDKDGLSAEDAEGLRLKRERKAKAAEVKQNLAKGLKKFVYGSNVIWAMNEKNADRKAKNKGYL